VVCNDFRVHHPDAGNPIGANEIVFYSTETFGAPPCTLAKFMIVDLESSSIQSSSGVIDRCNLGYKVHTGLALDDIVVTKSLVPHLVPVDALVVYLHKVLLEADDAISV